MSQRGFTLLELLIAVAIMGIIAAVTLVRTDLIQADAEINSAGQQIINMAKRVRQQSISVAAYRGIFPSYGLYFDTNDTNHFIIYANCIPDDDDSGVVDHDDNFDYNDAGHMVCHNEIGDAESPGLDSAALVEKIRLENNAKIKNIKVVFMDNAPEELVSASVNYLRPEPTVWITPNPNLPETEKVLPVGYLEVVITDKAERYEQSIYFHTSALVETTVRSLK